MQQPTNTSFLLSTQKYLSKLALPTIMKSATILCMIFNLAAVTTGIAFVIPAAIVLVLTMDFVCKYCKAQMNENKYHQLQEALQNQF